MLTNATRYLTNLLLFLFDRSPDSLNQLVKIRYKLFALHIFSHFLITFDPYYPDISFTGGRIYRCLIITQLSSFVIFLI